MSDRTSLKKKKKKLFARLLISSRLIKETIKVGVKGSLLGKNIVKGRQMISGVWKGKGMWVFLQRLESLLREGWHQSSLVTPSAHIDQPLTSCHLKLLNHLIQPS